MNKPLEIPDDKEFTAHKRINDLASGLDEVAQRHLLQQLGHGVIVVNKDNRLLYAEGETDNYIQFGAGEQTTELPDVMKIARAGLESRLRAALHKVWNGQSSVKIDARVQRDGAFHFCEMQVSKLPGRPEEDLAAMVIFTPIKKLTPQAKPPANAEVDSLDFNDESNSITAEQALMEVEQDLAAGRKQVQTISGDVPPLIAFVSRDYQYSFVNATYAKQFNRSVAEVIGHGVREVVGDNNFAQIQPHLKTGLAGKQVTYNLTLNVPDSDLIIYKEVTYFPDMRPDGTIAGVHVLITDITERARAEEELADREAHLRSVIDGAFTFLAVMDVGGVVLDINKMSLNAIGTKREETVGAIFWDLPCWSYDSQIADAIRERFAQCVETVEPVPFRLTFQAADKNIRVADAAFGPITDADGRVTNVVASGSDVTEQHAAQVALATSRSRLKTAMKAARMGSFVWDRVTDEAEFDDEWLEAAGIPRTAKMTSNDFFSLLHLDDVDRIQKITQESYEGEGDYKCEFRILRPDGEVRWLAGVGNWILGEDGERRKLAGINWDITEQKLVEQEVRLSEERMRLAASAAGLGAFHIDLDRDRVFWSDEFKKLVGIDPNDQTEVAVKDLPEFIHPDDRLLAGQHVEKVLNDLDNPDHGIVHRIIRNEGEVRWIRMQTRSMYEGEEESKRIRLIVGTFLDITAQRESEEILATAKRQAEAASESKSAFLANMSHEIRTPMTAILGYADLLEERVIDDESRDYLGTIRRNGDYLLGIINDILDLSKIEADKFDIDVELFDPSKVVEDVRGIMDVRANERGIKLVVDYATSIPIIIESDAKRLKQILINLVGNAIKFTTHGGVKILVAYADRKLRFEVCDTGIGMTPEQRERLFKPFSQGDSSITQQFGGTGLGLAISGRLATMLGGEIICDSEINCGSTFIATIDIGKITNVDLVTPKGSTPQTINEDSTLKNIRLEANILVVDDRRDIRFLSKQILGKAGANITEAEDGLLAVETVEQIMANGETFDLILLDMQMPNLDGYDTAATLRRLGYGGPIIALTADAMQGDMNKCLEAGCNDYLSKPIDAASMLKLVSKLTSA